MSKDQKVGVYIIAFMIVAALGFILVGCDPDDGSASDKASEDVQQLANRLYSQVGTPEIQNFTEYKFAKQIMELRDKRITTYTYYIDRQGRKHFVCESVGYGLPYSTQVTNPKRIKWEEINGWTKMPQREPNGLYMPENVSATWVLCSDGEGGVTPYYSEPKLLVTTNRLTENVVGDPAQ